MMAEPDAADSIVRQVSAAVRGLPGAIALYLVGSRARGSFDIYSDVDLRLVVQDLDEVRPFWPMWLGQAGTIEVAVQLDPGPAYAVLFEGASYYHKLDINLIAEAKTDELLSTQPDAIPLWQQAPMKCRHFDAPASFPVLAHESYEGLAMDEALAAGRYVRARKRGHAMTCWRFMRAKPNRLLALLAGSSVPDVRNSGHLTTIDFLRLDASLPDSLCVELQAHLDWSTGLGMDRNCCWLTERIMNVCAEKASQEGQRLLNLLQERQLAFLRTELQC